jgi:PAS domain S-box-containing protein
VNGGSTISLLGRLDAVLFEAAPTTLTLASALGGGLARLGVSPEECLADPRFLAKALHPADRDAVVATLRAVGDDREPRQIEHRMIGADGQERWFRTEVHAIESAGELRLRGLMIDVTEAQKTAEKLRATEERLRQVFNNTPVALFALDEHGNFTFAEGSALSALGLKPGQTVGHNIFNNWRDEPEVLEHVRRALGGENYTAVDVMRRLGSSWETRWAPIVDRSGRPRGATAVALNVTDRRRAEEELAATVSLLRATLEAVTDGVLVVDNSGRLVEFNRRFVDMWQIPDEITDSRDDVRALAYVIDQLRDPDQFLRKVRALYAEPTAASHDVLEFRDGRIFERDSRPQRVEGKNVGRVWSFRDVTAERRASQRASFLAAASKILAGPLDDAAPLDAIARLSVPFLGDWSVLYLVRSDGRIEGAAAHHIDAGKIDLVRRVRPDLQRRGQSIATIVREGTPLVVNDISDDAIGPQIEQPDGPVAAEQLALLAQLRPRAFLGVPLRVRGQTLGAIGFASGDPHRRYDDEDLAVATDLAQRAALTLENQRLYRASLEAVALRDEFLSVASHELRTPVTSLQLAVQSLLTVGDDAPPGFLRQALESAERQTRRLSKLVDALLDVSRVQAGRLELQCEPTDLVALARDVTRALAEDARRAGCSVALATGEPGLPSLIGRWDRARLEQVVTNLLSNALKYGAGKPVLLTVARTDRSNGTDARALLVVSDHGIGVPAGERERIFERFERAVSSRHYGGLGLGLYIVRRIVEAHGGAVSVDEAPGGGAQFTVALPLQHQ